MFKSKGENVSTHKEANVLILFSISSDFVSLDIHFSIILNCNIKTPTIELVFHFKLYATMDMRCIRFEMYNLTILRTTGSHILLPILPRMEKAVCSFHESMPFKVVRQVFYPFGLCANSKNGIQFITQSHLNAQNDLIFYF